ncbi:RNA polymerase sigma-70 factor, ECF subfamily [Rhodococcus triatomae]|uniref:RNA polymerase sigma-70 factor, ECF subfamily n=1 Tax=Rhodococcus triatomae TaxID=300028 RepID=A0A1G8AW12_9NOCA|nr:RNA polymerase sigma-70 factor, ECF subfamily [Rhodococcus triatomae]
MTLGADAVLDTYTGTLTARHANVASRVRLYTPIVASTDVVDDFETHRRHLLAVAYRLTGSVTDAEDAVQESWLRLDHADVREIRDLRAWLTTVVGRICLDHLRSAAVRRERYVGQWLPEPIVTDVNPSSRPDPLETLVQDEDARMAAMVVLDTMSPQQRIAFVLHDGFSVPFDEISAILGVETATARQLASRGRRAAAAAPPPVSADQHAEAVLRLVEAMATGDIDRIVATLDPDVVMVGDADGKTGTAINVIRGPEKFARFFLGLVRRYGWEALLATRTPVLVNGRLGFYGERADGDGTHPPVAPRVSAYAVRDGRVCAAYDVANPDKFHGIVLGGQRPFDAS